MRTLILIAFLTLAAAMIEANLKKGNLLSFCDTKRFLQIQLNISIGLVQIVDTESDETSNYLWIEKHGKGMDKSVRIVYFENKGNHSIQTFHHRGKMHCKYEAVIYKNTINCTEEAYNNHYYQTEMGTYDDLCSLKNTGTIAGRRWRGSDSSQFQKRGTI